MQPCDIDRSRRNAAIARNIQHSLKGLESGGHFRHLKELYEAGELTDAINRIVEDINHRFVVEELIKNAAADKIEALYIATDAPSHARLAIMALEHGLHVASAVPAFFGKVASRRRLTRRSRASTRTSAQRRAAKL